MTDQQITDRMDQWFQAMLRVPDTEIAELGLKSFHILSRHLDNIELDEVEQQAFVTVCAALARAGEGEIARREVSAQLKNNAEAAAKTADERQGLL